MSKSNLEESKKFMMKNYGRLDVIFDHGIGSKLYDTNGKEYLDFVSGIAVNCLGHSHPVIIKAITEQSAKLMHVSNIYWSEPNILLAEKLCTYSGLDMAFFCNSGTEAIEAALKLGRKYGKIKGGEEKNIILSMENSFHGRTMGALTVTAQPKYQKAFMPLIPGVMYANFNDIEDVRKKINSETCAVIIEPIQGEGGIVTADINFLKEVRELCDKFEVVLIFDEVQCGMGRTGSLFAYEQFGVVPDIVCLAKALAGGFPIGAIIANEKVGSAFVPGDHGCTFGGNPLASAVSLAVISELVEGGVVEKVKEKGNYLIQKINDIKAKYDVIDEIRGRGLLLGISLKVDPKAIINSCYEKGLLLTRAGENVIRLLPPLNVTIEDMDLAMDILEEAIRNYK